MLDPAKYVLHGWERATRGCRSLLRKEGVVHCSGGSTAVVALRCGYVAAVYPGLEACALGLVESRCVALRRLSRKALNERHAHAPSSANPQQLRAKRHKTAVFLRVNLNLCVSPDPIS